MSKEQLNTKPELSRSDLYIHLSGNEITDPALVELALKVHAEGYTTMGFVSEDAVSPEGMLDETIDHSRGYFTEYYLAVNPNNKRDMVTMRKINMPPKGSVEDLPAFQLTKEGLFCEGITHLKALHEEGYHIKEIAGLARTKEASRIGVYELLRGVLQNALNNNEAWFFSIVSTTFDSLTKYFGSTAFNVIGSDVKINDYRVNERIKLRPSILLPDKLFQSMIKDIETDVNLDSRFNIIKMLLYFSEGLDNERMGNDVVDYIGQIKSFINSER